MADRLFNEKEVREILKRVVSSQPGSGSVPSDGISLAELKQIGSELGLDPGQVELAAGQLGSPNPKSPLSGRLVLERTVEGDVTAEDWLGMVAAMQRHFKGAGAVTQRGSNYDWAGSDDSASLALSVMTRGGRTRIRLESNRWLGIVMASVFFPVVALVASLSMAKHGSVIGIAPLLAAFGAVYYGIIRALRIDHLQTASALMQRLVDEVERDAPLQVQASTGVETTESPTIRLQTNE